MIDKSFQALIYSLVIHALLLLAYWRSPAPEMAPDATTVEILYNENTPRRVVYDDSTPDTKSIEEKLKEQSKNLSRITKRVKEEQVARPRPEPSPSFKLSDLTPQMNISDQARSAMDRKTKSNKASDSEEKDIHIPQLPALGAKGQSQDTLSRSVVIGGNTQDDWIPGVKEGSFTALNTDQFTYYSFFSRVKDAIRFRWVQRVRNFSQQASPQEIMTLARIPSPTKLEIVLSKKGDILKIETLQTSGSAELDAAAVNAFWAASPLNNPPAEMAEDDGLIRIHYAFQVIWQPTYMVGQ